MRIRWLTMIAAGALFAAALPAQARQWIPTTPLPDNIWAHGLVATSTHLYNIGGFTSLNGPIDSNRVLFAPLMSNGSCGNWTEGSPLPTNTFYHAVVATGDTLYVLGGQSYSDEAGFFVTDRVFYSRLNPDLSPGVWQESWPLPGVRFFLGAVIWNNRLYAVGGANERTVFDTVYSASINQDGSLDQWRVETQLNEGVYCHATVVVDGAMYVIGGFIDGGNVIHNGVYFSPINPDGTLAGWSGTTSYPLPISNHSAAATCGRIYATGGWNGINSVSSCYSADINPDHSIGAWTPLAALPQPSYLHGMTCTPTCAYLSGGSDSINTYAAVHRLPLPADATAPAITQQPTNQSIHAGQQAAFSVTATGRAPLAYHWRKGGVNLTDGGPISGSTTATLTINPASAAHAGTYDVVVLSSCGSAVSDQVTLAVLCVGDIAPVGSPNGAVDVGDLLLVITNWGAAGVNPADVNGDAVVNVADLLAVITHWGACP